jgi:hypothetical protein
MKLVVLLGALGVCSLVGCASSPPPNPATPVETTSAAVPSREAFTPPDQWEMQIADKPAGTASETGKDAPATKVQADTTAGKRQPGGLITMPGKRTGN